MDKKNNIQYLNGLLCTSNGVILGLGFSRDTTFVSTILKRKDYSLLNNVEQSLPLDVIKISSSNIGGGIDTLTPYTLTRVELRGSEADNEIHFNYYGDDIYGNEELFSSSYGLLTKEQIIKINNEAIVTKYNKVIDDRDELKIENDFAIKLFQNIKLDK